MLAEYWERGEFPEQLARPLIDLDLMEPAELTGAPGAEQTPARGIYQGFRIFELARTDASAGDLVHRAGGAVPHRHPGGRFARSSRREWMPKVIDFSLKGVFSLTEPESRLGHRRRPVHDRPPATATAARGFSTVPSAGSAAPPPPTSWRCSPATSPTARSRPSSCDRTAAGVTLEKIHGKTALRMMQNAHITLDGVRVPEAMRLHERQLLQGRRRDAAGHALRRRVDRRRHRRRRVRGRPAYVTERRQFGRPLGSFQLVQEKLARMLGNVTASLSLVVRLTEQQAKGIYRDQDSALAKMQTSLLMRETVALAREVVGGNGITLATDVARFHADAEAVYSYEGTHDINALIIGRALTGESAFTR